MIPRKPAILSLPLLIRNSQLSSLVFQALKIIRLIFMTNFLVKLTIQKLGKNNLANLDPIASNIIENNRGFRKKNELFSQTH